MPLSKLSQHAKFGDLSVCAQTATIILPMLWLILWKSNHSLRHRESEKSSFLSPWRRKELLKAFGESAWLGECGRYILFTHRFISLMVLLHGWYSTLKYAVLPFPLFSFFTIWNYTILTGYYIVTTFLSITTCWVSSSSVLFNWFRNLGYPLWLLFQQQLTSNIIVSVGYWCLTVPVSINNVPAAMLFSLTSFVQHGFNSVSILVEFFLLALPIRWIYLDIVTAASVVYMLVSIPRFGTLPSIPVDLTRNLAIGPLLLLLIFHGVAHACFCWLSEYNSKGCDDTELVKKRSSTHLVQ